MGLLYFSHINSRFVDYAQNVDKNIDTSKQIVYSIIKEGHMKIQEKIKFLRKKYGYSQEDLGKLLGVSKQAISMYERGERGLESSDIEKLADIFNVDINVLYGRKSSPIKIPVLGYVAAGLPIEAVREVLDYEEISPDMLRDGSEYFALKIKGSSMEPKISDGDVVIVRVQPDVDSGQVAIVCVNGEEATCKKILKQQGGIVIQPLNPAYETVFYSIEQIESIPITIIGRVVELRAKF